MTIGIPILIPASQVDVFQKLTRVSFARQDTASFDENLLQRIIDEAPEIIPVKDFYPATKSVRSLGREIPVDLGGGRSGFIDNLLITNDGHLVVIETKLHRNPEAVREAVIQALEYGMSMQNICLSDLESRLRRCENTKSRLNPGETIYSRVDGMDSLQDDFIAEVERYLRTGEILLLVVADGIRLSVENITEWMNKNLVGSPIKFGLVELRFYLNEDGSRLIMPKTLLKTVEISRHVIVVDVQNKSSSTVQTNVANKSPNLSESGRNREIRSVEPMTKDKLLSIVDASDKAILQEFFNQLESIGFVENTKTAAQLRFGLAYPGFGIEFLPVLYLEKNAVWMQPVKAISDRVGLDQILLFRGEMMPSAKFWRPDQMKSLNAGIAVKYSALPKELGRMMETLENFKKKVDQAVENEASG